mmetsp:Transcript_42151/g.67758  ORF Transcript_42151/g.67758 Transcript_42151/m.67758 type:complete len:180 (-) Transcript_42151:106-645(-)|eukprot:CAMPEP_0179416438 /NCGR_PEP_ID=MMETSP0799-20121207/6799_1 /TAXON_ID=46947 /ORGANISM="Geminigera cryophila, Strain CCMP2564" /LENGTH=179 /DNA_ID=CAMNT_0021189311 /DNA_START=38 /DNA_END=577 /DNA_ORIENTATION=+
MDWFGMCAPQKEGGAGWCPGMCEPGRQEIKFGEQVMDSGSAGPKPDVSAAKREPRAGIGIIVALSPDNSLYVHTVCPGATAQGILADGDVLLKVDGEDVFRAPAPHVADLLLGQPGTKVRLTVRRTKPHGKGIGDGDFEFHDVSVVRARTDPVSARKAVYEAFLSTSGQKKDSPVPLPQ